MAKGYVIFVETIRDQAGYDAYVAKAFPTLLEHGGRPLVLDDGTDTLEGSWPGQRTIVIEFESVEAARAWYRSPAYQAIIPERQASTDATAVIATGLETGA